MVEIAKNLNQHTYGSQSYRWRVDEMSLNLPLGSSDSSLRETVDNVYITGMVWVDISGQGAKT